MTYDPFARGPHPVGVRTATLADDSRGRTLPVEIWYPASDGHRGADLDPAKQDRFVPMPNLPDVPQQAVRDAAPSPGVRPWVVFSHGYSSHRRQTTHLTTHLASHGYVVVAPDHVGNTTLDVLMEQYAPSSPDADPRTTAVAGMVRSAGERPLDIAFVVNRALDGGLGDLSDCLDPDNLGATGHSFGGWTALSAPSFEPRVRSVFAMAPSGGDTPTFPAENPLTAALRLDRAHEASTLVLAGERDTFLPLHGIRGLFARVPGPKQLWVLGGADHLHFMDRVDELHELFRAIPPPALYAGYLPPLLPIGELCPPALAYETVRALAVAHFDATLADRGDAKTWLENRALADTRARGIALTRET